MIVLKNGTLFVFCCRSMMFGRRHGFTANTSACNKAARGFRAHSSYHYGARDAGFNASERRPYNRHSGFNAHVSRTDVNQGSNERRGPNERPDRVDSNNNQHSGVQESRGRRTPYERPILQRRPYDRQEHAPSSSQKTHHEMTQQRPASSRYRHLSQRRACRICSYKQASPVKKKTIFNHHFSACQIRVEAGVEGSDRTCMCPTCGEGNKAGKTHAAMTTGRINICLSFSTIHEFWRYEGFIAPHQHIDFITSPGARVETLMGMWKVDYGTVDRGCDILLIGGLNNCKVEDDTAIMTRIREFHELVNEQTEKYHPEQGEIKPKTAWQGKIHPPKVIFLISYIDTFFLGYNSFSVLMRYYAQMKVFFLFFIKKIIYIKKTLFN